MDGVFAHNIRTLSEEKILAWMNRCNEHCVSTRDKAVQDAAAKTYNVLEEELIRRGYYE